MMADIKVDCVNQTCPIPLVEARKAIASAEKGQKIVIKGNHPASKKEIPMAARGMGLKVLGINEVDGVWTIQIRK
jgi:TusA-related sulfurtransferase